MAKKIGDTHKLYDANIKKWKLINDICDSENLKLYLVPINPQDLSEDNIYRNYQYFKRAVFYAIAGFTSRGLTGLPFRKWPKLEIPNELEYINKNVDAMGTSIYQQSQECIKNVVRIGRVGLLVDYPIVETPVSKADMQAGKVFANIQLFKAEQILDWGTISIGAEVKFGYVVLSDVIEEDGDEIDILRVLKLVDGVYISEQYRKVSTKWELHSSVIPVDGKGNVWDEIPFQFVGSESNTHKINDCPMYDLCKINIGHYNNSAEYEDSVYQCGQAQPWMSGLTDEHLKLLNANNMYIGSGRLIGVPPGEQFGFAQASPNDMVSGAMKDKLELMVGLGAMFIQPGSAVKTATQSEGEQQVQHSILSLIVSNISEAYTKCLFWMCKYMKIDWKDDYQYTINQDFVPKNADAQTITAIVTSWMQGAISPSAMITWFQKQGIEDPEKTVEEIQDEIAAGQQNNINLDQQGNTNV